MSDINKPFVVSHSDDDAAVLREQFQQQGYLFFKNYVAADRCKLMLQELLAQLQPHITAGEGAAPPQLNGEPFFETDPVWDDVYPKIQALEGFHGFFHEPEVQALMQTVTDSDAFVYPMKMARISTPRKIGYETPPHQDAHSHNAGPTMAGIWVALHDVSADMGRVKVLANSHLRGVRPVFTTQGVGGIQCEIYEDEDTWHVSDFNQGDVLIFHSRTVHKAEPNVSENSVRLSIDTRFCDYGAPVFSSNLEPHHGWRIDGLDWDAIYRDWDKTRYQYYWQDYPNLF